LTLELPSDLAVLDLCSLDDGTFGILQCDDDGSRRFSLDARTEKTSGKSATGLREDNRLKGVH